MKRINKALVGLAVGLVATMGGSMAFSQSTGVKYTPYLIYPNTPSEMQVLWMDYSTETDAISWYSDASYQNQVGSADSEEYNTTTTNFATKPTSSTELHQHAYTIANLNVDTKYYYKVVDANGVEYKGSFITAPSPDATHVKFTAQGDSRSQPYALDGLDQVMMQFAQYSPDGGQTYPNAEYQRLSIANGDWVSTDGDTYWNTQWFLPGQTHVRAYTANTPLNGCKGNHDNASGYSASFPKYYPYPYPTALGAMTPKTTSCATNSTSGVVQQIDGVCTDANGNPYYNNLFWSFDYGPVHFTVIDEYSAMDSSSAQYAFVQNDLATTTKPWKVVIYHAPAYSAGSDGDNTGVRVYEDLYTKYGVDVIFSGHSHNYARCGAYNTTQASSDVIALNVPHFTSGGGGAPVYQVDLTNTGSFPHVITAWPAVEFMAFDVDGDTMTMTSYQANGIVQNASAPQTNSLSYTMIEQTVLHHFSKNATSQVETKLGNFVYNRATKTYNGALTIKNNGPALTGNVQVVLDGILNLQDINTVAQGLSNEYSTKGNTTPIANNPAAYKNAPAGVGLISTLTLLNQTGSNNGEPMIQASSSGIPSGGTVTVPLQFSNPNNVKITFTPIVYQE